MFELGFAYRKIAFSGPGSLTERSRSAFRVFVRSCACAATPAIPAAATVEPIRKMFLLDNSSRVCSGLSLITDVLLRSLTINRCNLRSRPGACVSDFWLRATSVSDLSPT